jgi:hypothetical protein
MAENAKLILSRAERRFWGYSAVRAALAGDGVDRTDTRTSMRGEAIADSTSILERAT